MKLNHNKHNLQVGDVVLADNRNVVKIISFTPNKMFAMVYPNEGSITLAWELMTARLTPLTTSKTEK